MRNVLRSRPRVSASRAVDGLVYPRRRERWRATAVLHRRAGVTDSTDGMMPGLDGFAMPDAIRGDPTWCLVPMMLLSAHAGEEAFAEGLNAGANDYIVKRPMSG